MVIVRLVVVALFLLLDLSAFAVDGGPTGWCTDARGRNFRCGSSGPAERPERWQQPQAPVIEDRTPEAAALLREARSLISQAAWEQAADKLHGVLRIKEEWADAHMLLGIAVEQMAEKDLAGLAVNFHGLWKEAQRHYRNALARATDPALQQRIRDLLAACEAKADRFESAFQMQATSDALRRLWARADTAFDRKDWPAAEDLYRQVLDMAPNDPAALYNLANVLAWQDRNAEALALIRRAKALAPQDADIRRLSTWLEKDAAAAEEKQRRAEAERVLARENRERLRGILDEVTQAVPREAKPGQGAPLDGGTAVDLTFLDPDKPMVIDPRTVKETAKGTPEVPTALQPQVQRLLKDIEVPSPVQPDFSRLFANRRPIFPDAPSAEATIHEMLAGKRPMPSGLEGDKAKVIGRFLVPLGLPFPDDRAGEIVKARMRMALVGRDACLTLPRDQAAAIITQLIFQDAALERTLMEEMGLGTYSYILVRTKRWHDLMEVMAPGWRDKERKP